MPKKSRAKCQFRSRLEEKFDGQLRESGAVYSYESCTLSYVLERRYKPDFIVEKKDGSQVFLEVKGYLRPEDRTKMVAVKKNNPGADIRFVFAKNQQIKGSKMMYSDWCRKYGFEYCFGQIPKKWLK